MRGDFDIINFKEISVISKTQHLFIFEIEKKIYIFINYVKGPKHIEKIGKIIEIVKLVKFG